MMVAEAGFAAAQARVSQLSALLAPATPAAPAREDGAAFNRSLDGALREIKEPSASELASVKSAELTRLNKAPATVERPFVHDPSSNTPVLKDGAKEVFTKAAVEARAAAIAEAKAEAAVASRAAAQVARADGPRAIIPAGVAATAGVAADGTSTAEAVLTTAKKYLGIPYKWGGTNPDVGLDCSGLVQLVYKQHGVKLPRVSQDQQHAGVAVDGLKNARPGDLVFFNDPATHVGIYVGDGKMLHAPRTGDVVKISPLHKNLTDIRRVLPSDAWTPPVAGAPVQTAAVHLQTGPLARAPETYQRLFLDAEEKHGVKAELLAAVARAESNFNPKAVSRAGAQGLMQLMPGTARGLGVKNSFDPAQAVDGAARLLRDHLNTFGSVDLALAAYNAGPGAVRRYNGVPPYAETQNYVRKITANLGSVAA